MAEREGFEPSRRTIRLTVFETASFGRSDTSPCYQVYMRLSEPTEELAHEIATLRFQHAFPDYHLMVETTVFQGLIE